MRDPFHCAPSPSSLIKELVMASVQTVILMREYLRFRFLFCKRAKGEMRKVRTGF
jgi:hypothetical protein